MIASKQQGVPQTANLTLQTPSDQQSKLNTSGSRRATPKTSARPQNMSDFSFRGAARLQQQPKGKGSHPEIKSNGMPDGGSTHHVDGVHSAPTVCEDVDANREESAFWKDKGNVAFKAKKWEVAAEAYSRSAVSLSLLLLRWLRPHPPGHLEAAAAERSEVEFLKDMIYLRC